MLSYQGVYILTRHPEFQEEVSNESKFLQGKLYFKAIVKTLYCLALCNDLDDVGEYINQ